MAEAAGVRRTVGGFNFNRKISRLRLLLFVFLIIVLGFVAGLLPRRIGFVFGDGQRHRKNGVRSETPFFGEVAGSDIELHGYRRGRVGDSSREIRRCNHDHLGGREWGLRADSKRFRLEFARQEPWWW